MARTQVRSNDVADGELTDADVASANKDGTSATPSLRTIGSGAAQAAAGNHTHAGTGSRSATLVVAAVDASAAEIAGSDYQCDGTADDVQITAAIAALPAGGGTVVLTSGTFTCAAAGITLKSGLRLIGQGESTIVKLATGANGRLIHNVFTPGTLITGVTFDSVTFDGNGTNQSDGAARDDRSMIMLAFINDLCIIRCKITNGRHGAALRLSECHRALLLGNKFLNNGVVGAAFIGDHNFTRNSDYLRIIGNYYETCTDSGTAQDGVWHSTVMGNTYNNCELGISVCNSATETDSTERAARWNSVIGNIIKGKGGAGTSVGIKVSTFGNTGPGNMKDVTINGNEITNCDRAMWVEEVDRCIIANNGLGDAAGANKQLMILATTGTANGIQIQNNNFYNTNNRGISFDTINALDVDVYDNVFNTVSTPIGGTLPATVKIGRNRGYTSGDVTTGLVTALNRGLALV